MSYGSLKRNIKLLTNIELEIEAVKATFQDTKQQIKDNLYDKMNFSVHGIGDDFAGAGGFIGGLGIGVIAAGLLLFTPLGVIAIVTASIAAAIGGSFSLGMLDLDGLRDRIKVKVLELGFKKFEASKDKISENLHEIVKSAINKKVQTASEVIEQVISLYEKLLEQQDKVHQATLEQRNTEKVWIAQKCEEIKQLQIKIDKEYC